MEPIPELDKLCWSCQRIVSPKDQFCRHCGKSLTSIPWYYQHWGIILLTLLALGPFSLILVWRSPALSRKAQWIHTAVIGIVSVYMIYSTYRAFVLVRSLMNNPSLLNGFVY